MDACVLGKEKACISCGECELCDLDPNKLCDNCCRCIQSEHGDYAEIQIEAVIHGET